MSALDRLIAALVEHGPALLLGTTIVLAFGLLLARVQKTPAQRRRIGIWTAIGCAGYLVIAAVPLPRVLAPEPVTARPVDTARASGASGERPDAVLSRLPAGLTPAQILDALGIDETGAPAAADPVNPPIAAIQEPTELDPPREATGLDWSHALAMTYLGSAGLLLLHHLLGLLRLRRILARSVRADAELHAAVGLPERVQLRIARDSVRPFCAGWLRPVIVLGPELMAPDRRELREAVLRHEAAHLRVSDPLVQCLFALLALPLSLHPLFWWLRADVRFHSEVLADEAAAGSQRTAYARELLDLVDDPTTPVRAVGTIAIFQRPSAFYRRIQMLLQPTNRSTKPISRLRRASQATAMFALVGLTAGAFGVPATAQSPRRAALEAQSEALRAEISALRAQLAQMRAELQQDPVASPPTAPTPTSADHNHGRRSAPGSAVATPPEPAMAPPGALKPAHPLHRSGHTPSSPSAWPPATGSSRRGIPGAGPAPSRRNAASPAAGPPGVPGPRAAPSPATDPVPGATSPAPAPVAGVPHLHAIPTIGRHFASPAATASPPTYPAGLPGMAAIPEAPAAPMATATAEATVALTSRLLDLDTEIEILRGQITETKDLVEQKMVSKSELRRAEAQLRNVEKKRHIVRDLVDGEIDATKAEMKWLKQEIGRASRQDKLRLQVQMVRAEGRYKALRAAR